MSDRDQIDHPLDFDSVKKLDAIMGSGGLVVMDENTCMVEVARFFMSFTQRESCGKCVPCREGTKRMLEILEKIVAGKGEMPIWMSWKNLQTWFRVWLCADLVRVHRFRSSVL